MHDKALASALFGENNEPAWENDMKNVMAVVLAGGKGARLEPLTRDRAKPAVPFGGGYRIVDFTLSNCLNSGVRRIILLTQYKAMSLDRHINNGWRRFFCGELGEFIDVVPPQQRIDEQWYQGTADAVYQNIYSLEKERPEVVLILSGDHIYKMDYSAMVRFHQERGADLTIAALPVPRNQAHSFGVMGVDANHQVIDFEEKPLEPKALPNEPNRCLASMGVYVFRTTFLFDQLIRDANDPVSAHDFGKNIIPHVVGSERVFAFPFKDENRKVVAYWRDVGTIDAFYEANMDLTRVDPLLNVYDQNWPIRTKFNNFPPPKFVFGSDKEDAERTGTAMDSVVCSGTIISGGRVIRSVLGHEVRVNSFSRIEDSILFDRVHVGRHAKIRRAIIDKDVHIPAGIEIGFDLELDRQRGFTISPGGVVVIGKSDKIIESPVLASPQLV
jgi:glucose-1-phosphate adenylyltransferase